MGGYMTTVDPQKIAELQLLFGNEVGGLMDAFVVDSLAHLANMRLHAESGEWDQLGEVTHNLKGSCANIGADRLASMASDLVEQCRRGAVLQAQRLVADIAQEFDYVRSELQQLSILSAED